MTSFQKALIVLAVAALFVCVWLFRFEVYTTTSSDEAYRLDRWTGDMHYVNGYSIVKVRHLELK